MPFHKGTEAIFSGRQSLLHDQNESLQEPGSAGLIIAESYQQVGSFLLDNNANDTSLLAGLASVL